MIIYFDYFYGEYITPLIYEEIGNDFSYSENSYVFGLNLKLMKNLHFYFA